MLVWRRVPDHLMYAGRLASCAACTRNAGKIRVSECALKMVGRQGSKDYVGIIERFWESLLRWS